MTNKAFIPESFIGDSETMATEELAKKYNKAISTIYKWKKYIKTRPEVIKRGITINGYILGILWGVGYDNGQEFIVRHRDVQYIQTLKDYFQLDNSIIKGESNTQKQYMLKITSNTRKNILKVLKKRAGLQETKMLGKSFR